MLTPRQIEARDFIAGYIKKHDYAPSLDEIADALKIGKSGVHRILLQLEERGAIRRMRGRARAMELVHPTTTPTEKGGE